MLDAQPDELDGDSHRGCDPLLYDCHVSRSSPLDGVESSLWLYALKSHRSTDLGHRLHPLKLGQSLRLFDLITQATLVHR